MSTINVLLYLIPLLLFLSACGDHQGAAESDETRTPEEQTLTQDTLPTFQTALGYFEASEKFFQDGHYRYAADFIVAGIEEVRSRSLSLSEEKEAALAGALRQLDRMAARLSRFKLEGPEKEIQRDFARAQLEMAHILLLIEPLGDEYPAKELPQLLKFCTNSVQRAEPFLEGETNTAATPILESGREILAVLSSDPTPATHGRAIAFSQSLRTFLSSHKNEIEVPAYN